MCSDLHSNISQYKRHAEFFVFIIYLFALSVYLALFNLIIAWPFT